jgi:hypothetical protein
MDFLKEVKKAERKIFSKYTNKNLFQLTAWCKVGMNSCLYQME